MSYIKTGDPIIKISPQSLNNGTARIGWICGWLDKIRKDLRGWLFWRNGSEKGYTRKHTGKRVTSWSFCFWGNLGILRWFTKRFEMGEFEFELFLGFLQGSTWGYWGGGDSLCVFLCIWGNFCVNWRLIVCCLWRRWAFSLRYELGARGLLEIWRGTRGLGYCDVSGLCWWGGSIDPRCAKGGTMA
jgi:hypothetical protein